MVQIVAMAQRVVLPREETRGRLEDLDSLLQLAVLAAKLPDLPSRLAGHPGRLALVYQQARAFFFVASRCYVTGKRRGVRAADRNQGLGRFGGGPGMVAGGGLPGNGCGGGTGVAH